jgi:plasmid stabilization system protein ParE
MEFKVVLSDLAQEQYDQILDYICNTLRNPQAVQNIMQDFDSTRELLKTQANNYGYCNSERLRRLKFHKLHFLKHKYIFIYRINNDIVVIEGIYHELQDYENSIG